MPLLNKQVNYDILGSFVSAIKGTDYENHIPALTRENIATVGNAIMNYQPTRDIFYNSFLVKITLQLFGGMVANNKFSFLKGVFNEGDIEDAYVDFIKGEVFDGVDENPFKVNKADIKTLYHQLDRRLLYTTTISDVQIRNAFNTPYGLSSLINKVLDTLYQSKEHDEFVMVKQLFVDNFANKGKVIELTATSKSELVEKLLYEMKKYSMKMEFNSRDYNKSQVMNSTSKDDQIIVLHSDYALDIDMGVLANTFNVDKLKLDGKVITVDNFNSNIKTGDTTETDLKIVACIFDRRGIRLHDGLVHMETQRNAKALYTNYFLHIWSTLSYAYFYNLIYFTEPATLTVGE